MARQVRIERGITIRLISLLIWFDEPVELLREHVESLPLAGVDELVALDGRYQHFPGETAWSPSDQLETLRAASSDAGIKVRWFVPDEPWRSEVDKRAYGFEIARRLDADYALVLDADERFLQAPNLKARLEGHDCAEVTMLKGPAPAQAAGFENDTSFPVILHGKYVQPRRCLFRMLPGLTVKGKHYWYEAADGTRLWGDDPVPALAMVDVIVEHRPHLRPAEREERAGQYITTRRELGLERAPA